MSAPPPSDILKTALAAHQQNDLETAERLYREILATNEADPDALHWLGVLALQVGAAEVAVSLIADSIKLRPGDPLATANLGNAYRAQGAWVEAETAYAETVRLEPGFVDVWIRYANMAREQSNHAAARPRIERAVALAPDNVSALFVLGEVCRELNDFDTARKTWERCAELDPTDHTGVRLALAALGALPTPARPNPAWIATLFDSYAGAFDRHLVETLGYIGPQVLAAAASAWAGGRAGALAIADIGCGTGLAGAALKPLAREMVGVDLSPVMIELAQDRAIYDRLEVGELVDWLEREAAGRFDLIVAADVLNYLGDLGPALAGARRCLAPEGRLIATLEEMEDAAADGYELAHALRYRHGAGYVARVAAESGLRLVSSAAVHLRRQAGEPVRSMLVELEPV